MKALRFIPLAALGLMAAACSNDESAPAQQEAKYITIEASIGNMTRATTTGNSAVFDQGDRVTLYAWTGSATAVPAQRVVDGVVNTLGTDGKWTPAITSCVATAAGTATINYLAQTVTAGEQSSVSLPAVTASTGYAATYGSIMVPQTGFRTVAITIDGQQFTYTHDEDIPLEAGKYTTLNLIVGRNKIEIGEVSINDWTEGTTIDGGQAM